MNTQHDILVLVILTIIILFIYNVIKKLFKKGKNNKEVNIEYVQDVVIKPVVVKLYDYSKYNITKKVDLLNFINSINNDRVYKIKEDICIMESNIYIKS